MERADRMAGMKEIGSSCMFSMPEGRSGWEGKGKSKVWIEGWRERRGWRRGRFLGVIKMVRVKPLRASWLHRSKVGSKWPGAGYGITKT